MHREQTDLEVPILAHIYMLRKYVHSSIFIQVVNVLDLHFQGQRLESSTLRSLYVVISQILTDKANIAVANKLKVTYGLSVSIFRYLYIPFAHFKDQGHAHFAHSKSPAQGHAHFNGKNRTNTTIAIRCEVA